jgi:acyl-coenzyme A synthetase/AMP-(fatty) acid ligase
MSTALLGRHLPSDEVCFGERGSRVRAQLMAYAGNIAQALAGLQPGERVVLACRDRYCFAASLLACLAQGRVVLLPENAQKEALSSLRQRMPVGAVLTDQADVPGLDVRALEDPEARSDADFVCGLGPNDVAFVAFTSGSTGEPQPHEKSLGQLTIEAENHVHELGLARARVVSAVPAHHIYGLLFGMLAPLLGGGSVVRENALFPEAIGDLISRHRASVLVAVPAHLSVLAQLPVQEWPTLTRIFSSAGPLPPSTAATLRARGLCVVEILGSTETGGIAHRSADGSPFLTLSPVEASVDEDGVLYVSSPWLAPWGSRVVRTAERAELVSSGFRHLGRVDSVVKVGGRRVDLQDVEAQLCRTPAVRQHVCSRWMVALRAAWRCGPWWRGQVSPSKPCAEASRGALSPSPGRGAIAWYPSCRGARRARCGVRTSCVCLPKQSPLRSPSSCWWTPPGSTRKRPARKDR